MTRFAVPDKVRTSRVAGSTCGPNKLTDRLAASITPIRAMAGVNRVERRDEIADVVAQISPRRLEPSAVSGA